MADITVRRLRFRFDEPVDLDVPDEMLGSVLGILALSLTMPSLEPYLIRTMRTALGRIPEGPLAEDVRRFSRQEGHHYRNHALFNERIREAVPERGRERLAAIEAALEADYRRYTATKPLRFNVAYAEGFEAMTCAAALSMAEAGAFEGVPGGEIWPWHMVEEIEHRTVAFEVFEHLVGSWSYRVAAGGFAQWHYLRTVGRLARCMADALGRRIPRRASPVAPGGRATLRRWLWTYSPTYDPARIELPRGVPELLARYTEMERERAAPAPA